MKTIFVFLLILVALPVHADSLRFTRISGGPPLPGLSDTKVDLGIIQDEQFKKIKEQIQTIVAALVKHERWISKEAVWSDIGPDAGYISAVIDLDGKIYTINSWYPLEKQTPTTAVSETQGLVSVKSKNEKQEVEARNSRTYQQIVSIFDFIPEPHQK